MLRDFQLLLILILLGGIAGAAWVATPTGCGLARKALAEQVAIVEYLHAHVSETGAEANTWERERKELWKRFDAHVQACKLEAL